MAPIGLRDLLGSLVASLVEGERHGARATIDFIRAVGFRSGEAGGDDWGRVRFVRFWYILRGPDGKPVRRRVRVPLLSLLPIPITHVAQAEYEFFLSVTDVRSVEDVTAREARAVAKPGYEEHGEIVGEIAPFVDNPEQQGRVPRVRIKIALKQSDLPAGIVSTLRRLDDVSGEDVARR